MRSFFLLMLSLLIFSCDQKKIKVDPENTIEVNSFEKQTNNVLKIGVAAMLTPEETLPAYDEIIKYIGKQLNAETEMVFTRDYESMNEMVKNKNVLIAFVCSGAYVIGHDEWGMQAMVAPVHNGESKYYSNIIVHKDCNFKKFTDLEGKKFAFTDPNSNTGKIVPTYELSKINRNANEFFSNVIYSGSHDNSIEAVVKKIVDAAAVDNLIWDYKKVTEPELTSETKVIEQFGPFTTPPVVCYPDLDSAVKNKIIEIFIKMHQDKEGKKILDKLLIDRFVIIDDSEYNSIRTMLN